MGAQRSVAGKIAETEMSLPKEHLDSPRNTSGRLKLRRS